jgi:hypothetical protein
VVELRLALCRHNSMLREVTAQCVNQLRSLAESYVGKWVMTV